MKFFILLLCRVSDSDTGSSTKLPCVQGEGYRKCTFHRIQPNFMVQGGDFTQEGPIPILHIVICEYIFVGNKKTKQNCHKKSEKLSTGRCFLNISKINDKN
jgi:cyclophilin family peptidyl-prolyl cis-trans isomerase